jgi:hypothetical protein
MYLLWTTTCEPVIIVNGNITLLYLGLTAEFENIQKRSGHISVLCVEF